MGGSLDYKFSVSLYCGVPIFESTIPIGICSRLSVQIFLRMKFRVVTNVVVDNTTIRFATYRIGLFFRVSCLVAMIFYRGLYRVVSCSCGHIKFFPFSKVYGNFLQVTIVSRGLENVNFFNGFWILFRGVPNVGLCNVYFYIKVCSVRLSRGVVVVYRFFKKRISC